MIPVCVHQESSPVRSYTSKGYLLRPTIVVIVIMIIKILIIKIFMIIIKIKYLQLQQ